MITVKVKLFAGLDKLFPGYDNSEFMPVEINPGETVDDLIEKLKLPEYKLIFINGVAAKLDYPLNDMDEISIFPPVGGG